MTRLAICSLLIVISVVASACATQRIAGRSSQDIHDEIQSTAADQNRDVVGGTPAGPF
jgi:predicted small secreted protein